MESKFINLLLDSASQYENKVAIIDHEGTRRTTYGELFVLASRVAAYIQDKGIVPQSFVCIQMPNDMEFMAFELGVWLSNCVAVPMGVSYPSERVRSIMQHCESPLILNADTFSNLSERIAEPIISAHTDNALLLYTSGSTGNPKGVLHTFETLDVNVPRPLIDELDGNLLVRDEVIYATTAPLYFAACMPLWDVLIGGGTIHLFSDRIKKNVGLLADYIKQHEINVCNIAPAALSVFQNTSDKLKVVTAAGEKLTIQHSKEGYILYNWIGQTETLHGFARYKMPDHPLEKVPIGKTYWGVEYRVVDDAGNDLPQGQIGELFLKGHFFKEYYKEPELTAEAYDDGWVHTKDLVYVNEDGDIQYVQRKDWMVKINGQRVEPGEVEIAIASVEGVKSAIVKGFDNGQGSQYLCAYYISETQDAEGLKSELSKRLPAYMIPAFFVKMDAFPINANGKLDRKSLQAPDLSAMVGEYVAPTNETETLLCESFANVLGMERIGVNDDFFKLGGDSIRVMKLQMMCPDLPLSSRLIYEHRTPKALALSLADTSVCLSHGATQAQLTQTQLGIYIECINRQGEAVYNNPFLYRLSARLDAGRLAEAIAKAVTAHPVLDATISIADDGEPIMVKKSWDSPTCSIEQMSEDALKALIPEMQQPFDLYHDRLFRIRIIETEQAQYLFVDIHHIIFDGTSMHIFLADIDRAYRGADVKTEEYTAFDIAVDEVRDRAGDSYARAKDWYKNAFGTSLEVSVPLPDIYDNAAQEFSHEVFTLDITSDELNEWCREHGVTANLLTTLAFGKTLSVYANTDTAVFSTIYNGRSSIQTSNTLAMLVKTLPVVIDFNKDVTITNMLADLKQQMLGAMANDIYSFAELASDTGMSSAVSFAYQADMHQLGTIAGANLVDTNLEFNASGEPFSCQLMTDAGNHLTLDMQYKSDSYSRSFVYGFCRTYQHIIKGMCTKENLADIECCDEEVLKKLDGFNDNDTYCYDGEDTVVSIFQKAAKRHPDHTAVVFKDKQYTYRQIDELTDKIGALIYNNVVAHQQEGGAHEPVVSIIIHRSEWMVLASLGALKAGCAYQPLDPSYPQERLNFMVKDANAVLLIADEDLCPIVNEYEGEVLLTNNIIEDASDLVRDNPNILPSREDWGSSSLLTLLYTSGSTGVPKGVMLEHRNLIAFCKSFSNYLGITSESNIAAYASFGFDANMQDIYCTLMNGATLHIIDEEIRLDMEALHRYFENEGVTHSFMTTQVGVQYLENYPQSTSLLHLVMGGEKLRAVKPEKLSYKIHNGYGPSETTCGCAFFQIDHWEQNIPIGKPLPTCTLYVVDKCGHRLPAGAPGELWISGPQVTRGYLNRPDKTAESFTPNPFGDGRVYHSGDIVRYREDGNIEFVGRKDGQVKIRGFRIELKEVEAIIRDFAGVKDVTVQAYDDPSGGKFMAAYVVMDDNPSTGSGQAQLDVSALKDFIASQKPPYMVPAVTMQIDSIPLTVNQKVDKKKLPVPQPTNNGSSADFVAPQGQLEETIADCVAEALALETGTVSAHDTFMTLGGTSIKAIRLMALLKDKGVEISIDQLLKPNDIRCLALIADYARCGEYVQQRTALLPAQKRMLHEHIINPDRQPNTVCLQMDIDETVTEEHIRKAVDHVARKHKTITSDIAYVGVDIPMQVFLDRKVPVSVIDAENDMDAVEIMMDKDHELRLSVNDLQLQPLFQLLLCKIDGASAYLMIAYNKILAEGWRIRTWIAELFETLKENGGDSICNWCYLLNTATEMADAAEKEDWSKEEDNATEGWSDKGLGRRSQNDDENDDNYKVLTETTGAKQLVFVHSGNTGSEAYIPLAHELEGFCSFAVLDQWNLYHQDDIKHGIPEIAKKYIEVLKKHQPEGPYNLGGWCYGGMIAYEMACQLTARGEKVEQLFMFDSHTVRKRKFKEMFTSQSSDSMREYFEHSPVFTNLIGRGLVDALVANSLQVSADMMKFQPQRYDGNVVFFKAITPAPGLKGRMAEYFEEMNRKRAGGYERYIPQDKLHIVDIKQHHDNIMNEQSLCIAVPVMKQYI